MAKLIGAHLSISKGIHTIQAQMESLGLDTCAIFLKSQRRYLAPPMKEGVADVFKAHVLHPELIVPHGSYLVNFGNPSLVEKSMECLVDDLERCKSLGIKMYNMHPGSDKTRGKAECLRSIGRNVNTAISRVQDVIILMENMAGQGNVVGSTFEELRDIIGEIEDKERVGVCLDTCHLFGAGFDITTEERFAEVMEKFDRVVGLRFLKAMHINDSKEALGSKKDRHESIGKGMIGEKAFRFIMNSRIFDNIPLILETPDPERYKEEAEFLRNLINK
ncbi:putative endonuclease [Encephalitozoon hellem ATCC 50504]|uniref:Apurinic-apyrimidinic endonuclease 1 n=1 Tax=Encephalitozoon hellem TaxID=27973 RepID=A0A9Q9C595_ENCHE|nr:putative endonuclease [Encephalitozoon hellem ATCC 50504]AFM99417.1 putative endonuclease [Encephalitozoon hellem ATCC 50504]UTX44426.1 apurinic endonuclease 4 [Encephalitozoon hellem]WEL39927.1 apurinic endonuclease [Encephalitozoon hellem]|eukprot:XP_003888398.1 putative endonuclease [Encephalitozoon hellem ATCC 50504]